MPQHTDKDGGEANIVVVLHKLQVSKASNYFATLKVDFPHQGNPDYHHSEDDSVTHRTEVQKNTKQPVFKARTFCFKLPHTSSFAFSELLLYSPCLYLQLFEVLRNNERGVAKPFCCATLAFSRDQIDSLVSRNTLALTLYLVANTNGANVGQCDIEIFMSDTASPPPASPPSPTPPVVVSQPKQTVFDSIQQNSLHGLNHNMDDAEHLIFTITVHCGVNLGSQNLPPPSPFVTAKTTRDAAAKRPAKTATMMSKNQRNVLWNEKLYVSMSRKDMTEGQGIFLAVIDFETKRYIGKCILPVKGITIGYQYHMRLLTHEDGYLLVSLSVEDKTDPEVNHFLKDSDLYHVQLSLKRLLESVQSQHSNMIAVVNLIDDGQAYKQNYIADNVPKIPFNTLLMAEAHDKFGMVIKHWCKVWQFCGPPNLNQLFEFTLEKRQRQTKYCITVEFFYLDFSLVSGTVTPISPMSPLSPVTPQTSIPHFPTGNSSKDSAGIVFWGSAVIPLFEFIKAPARTVTINEIEIPVYRSPHVVNYLELDIKRRDAHDYMRDIAPAKEKEKNQLKVRQATARAPSPSPLSPQIIRSSVSPPSRLSSPSPKPARQHGEEASSLIFGHQHRDSANYNYNLQNGLLSASAVLSKQHGDPGSGSPSHDTPHSPHFPIAKRGSIPRQTFRDLTIIPPTTPGPNTNAEQQANITPTQPPAAKPNRYSNVQNSSFIPISNKHSPSTSPVPPGSSSSSEGERNQNSKMYRYNNDMDASISGDVTTINDHYDTHDNSVNNNNNNNNNGFNGNDLRRLLEQQQMILDQLMKDREGTNTALKKVESDLTDLKVQNQALQRENTLLRAESVKKFDTVSMENKIVELTDSQQKMNAVIDSLQTENANIPKYLEANQKQEKVIQKLESLLTFSIAEMKKASKIQSDLQATNEKLQQELNQKKKSEGLQGVISKPRLSSTLDLSSSLSSTNGYSNEKAEVDSRIKRVENEMAKNAEALAVELNNLRGRLQKQKFPSDTNLPKAPSSHSIASTPSTSFTSLSSHSSSLSPTPSSSNAGMRKTRESLSANSSPSSSINGHPLSGSLSSSPSYNPSLDMSPPLSNFDKNWDLYGSKSNLSSSRIKARKNLPVKHKETGEYRRPHMLMPMSPPPSSS